MTIEQLEEEPLLSKITVRMITDPTFEKTFKDYLQTSVSSLYADIESAYSNPNCTCVKKLEKYFDSNKKQIAELIVKYAETSTIDIESYISQFNSQQITKMNLAGRVLKTTIKNWPSFTQQIDTAVYKSFSVVKEGDDILVFFL